MKKQALLTQKAYGEHLGISQQAVNKLVRSGKIPSVHGKIDCAAADAALAPSHESTGNQSLAEAQRRKEWALAGLRENELERKRGEVCDVGYVIEALEKHNAIVKSQLLAFPTRLIAGLTINDQLRRHIFAEATKATRQALTEMAGILGSDDALTLCPTCENRLRKLAAAVDVAQNFLPKEYGAGGH